MGLATLLVGHSTGGSRGFLLTPYYMTVQDQAWFIQDDLKATPRLTFNIGIRHEIHWPEKEIRERPALQRGPGHGCQQRLPELAQPHRPGHAGDPGSGPVVQR
jgi:hypothetical protein